MNKTIRFILILASLFLFSSNVFCETIKLKDGKVIEGKIIDKNPHYIKIESNGLTSIYFSDEIAGSGETFIPGLNSLPNEASTATQKEPKAIFKEISPAVVYITKETVFGGGSLGSGFIVKNDGVIVTNYHVVREAKDLNVRLKDGTIFPVTSIIYYDVEKDVCILKIDAKNLPVLTLGNSNNSIIGEKIYAIGNPLGLDYSFSDGLLSGTRDMQNVRYLQFTAPVSPGNSGGPLINPQGEAIGIVTMQLTEGQNLNFAVAINEIKQHISSSPKLSFQEFTETVSQADYYVLKGRDLALQGKYNEAISAYQQAVDINPKFIEAYIRVASIYNKMDQYQFAIDVLNKAIELEPNSYNLYCLMSASYNNLKKGQEAIKYCMKAIELDPNNAIAFLTLGDAYLVLGQEEDAVTNYAKAIQLDPNFAQPYTRLGLYYYNSGDIEEAVAYLIKSIELDPYYEEPYMSLGIICIEQGENEMAIQYLQRVIQINSNDAKAYALLGKVYAALGQYSEAKMNYEKAKELFEAQGRGNTTDAQRVNDSLNILRYY